MECKRYDSYKDPKNPQLLKIEHLTDGLRAGGHQRQLTKLLAGLSEDLAAEIQTECMGGLLPEIGVTEDAKEVARTFIGVSQAAHHVKDTTINSVTSLEDRFHAVWNIGTVRLQQMMQKFENDILKRLREISHEGEKAERKQDVLQPGSGQHAKLAA